MTDDWIPIAAGYGLAAGVVGAVAARFVKRKIWRAFFICGLIEIGAVFLVFAMRLDRDFGGGVVVLVLLAGPVLGVLLAGRREAATPEAGFAGLSVATAGGDDFVRSEMVGENDASSWRPSGGSPAEGAAPSAGLTLPPSTKSLVSGEVRKFSFLGGQEGPMQWSFTVYQYQETTGHYPQQVPVQMKYVTDGFLSDGDIVSVYGHYERSGFFFANKIVNHSSNSVVWRTSVTGAIGKSCSVLAIPLFIFAGLVLAALYLFTR